VRRARAPAAAGIRALTVAPSWRLLGPALDSVDAVRAKVVPANELHSRDLHPAVDDVSGSQAPYPEPEVIFEVHFQGP
jgi:hypothetical protein